MKGVKKVYSGVIAASIFMILVLRFATTQNPFGQSIHGSISLNATSPLNRFNTNPLEWVNSTTPADVEIPLHNTARVISLDTLVSGLYAERNLTVDERYSLLTWNQLEHLINNSETRQSYGASKDGQGRAR